MAMTRKLVVLDMVRELRGEYPEVEISPAVDFAEIKAGDENPVFVTLPIGQVNVTSRNDMFYDRAAVEAIRDAVNNRRVGGILGHLTDYERGYKFTIPSVVWVGAMLDDDGILWGKMYVMKTETSLREYVRITKATNGWMGTSIYGTGELEEGDNHVKNLQIESIDIAHPQRVGVLTAAAQPKVTTEMVNQEEAEVPTDENKNEKDKENKSLSESDQAADFKRQLGVKDERITELAQRNATLKLDADLVDSIREALGNPADVVAFVRELRDAKTALETENVNLLAELMKTTVADKVKVETMQPMVLALVEQKKPTTKKALLAAVDEVLDRPYVKNAMETAVAGAMGPNQQRPANNTNQDDKEEQFFQIPKEA